MALFGWGKGEKASASSRAAASGELAEAIENGMKDPDGRIRVEDLLSAAGAVTGQCCIAALGEFDPDDHRYTPGQAVFSTRMNSLLCADMDDWPLADPATTVFGKIYAGALLNGFAAADFPDMGAIFSGYADAIGTFNGTPDAWGRIRLSVPQVNWPREQPIRYGYELRPKALAVFGRRKIAAEDLRRRLDRDPL